MTDPKARLRAEARARRAAANAADPDAGARLAAAFPAWLIPPPGAVAAGYAAFAGEIDPRPLLARLAALGVALALPRTPAKGAPGPIAFHAWRIGGPLQRSAWGVEEPPADAPLARPVLVLAPLLAFDRRGTRLGYGQGHYDRALAALKADGPVTVAGLAYAAQEVARLPAAPHDVALDWIVTPDGAYQAQEI